MNKSKLIDYLKQLKSNQDYERFLAGLFTGKELLEFENRLTIVEELLKGVSQHRVAAKVGVGVATVSRGAKEISMGNFKAIENSKGWRDSSG